MDYTSYKAKADYNAKYNNLMSKINLIENLNNFKENFKNYSKLSEEKKKEFQPSLNEYFEKRNEVIENDWLSLKNNEKEIKKNYLIDVERIIDPTFSHNNKAEDILIQYESIKNNTELEMGKNISAKGQNALLQVLNKKVQLNFIPENEKKVFKEKTINDIQNRLGIEDSYLLPKLSDIWEGSRFSGRKFENEKGKDIDFEKDFIKFKEKIGQEGPNDIFNNDKNEEKMLGERQLSKFVMKDSQARAQQEKLKEKYRNLKKKETNQPSLEKLEKPETSKPKKKWEQQAIPLILIALGVMALIMLIAKFFNKRNKEKLATNGEKTTALRTTETTKSNNITKENKFVINKNKNKIKNSQKDNKNINLSNTNLITQPKDLSKVKFFYTKDKTTQNIRN